MTIAASISRAAAPDQFTVAGVRLAPFSIGHWLLLQRAESAFLSGDEITAGELLLATALCAGSYQDGVALLNDTRGMAKAVRQWRWRLGGGLRGWLRRKFRKPSLEEIAGLNLPREAETFSRYLSEHGAGWQVVNEWSVPITMAPESHSDPHEINAPAPMLILCALMAELRMDFNAAVNLPLPFARWLLAVNGERQRAVTIVDKAEMEDDQRRANEFAKSLGVLS